VSASAAAELEGKHFEYKRREPQSSVLHQLVREHLHLLVDDLLLDELGHPVPVPVGAVDAVHHEPGGDRVKS